MLGCAALGGLALAFAERGAKPAPQHAKPEPPAPNPDAPPAEPTQPVVPIATAPPDKEPVYRLDLGSARPFVQANTGRTTNVPNPPAPHADAPPGWFTHSWVPACTHEFFVQSYDERAAVGVRLTAGPTTGRPEAMLFVRPVAVRPNARLVLRVEYAGAGAFAPADVRVAPANGEARKGLRVLGKLQPTRDRWETATFKFVAPADSIQIEFHHCGPLGVGNELLLRSVELREDE